MDMKWRRSNAICIICGKGFYKRPSKNNCNCCSKECKEQKYFNQGKFVLIPYCKSKNISVDDFLKQIDRMHNLEKTKKKDRRKNYFLGVKKGWEVIHIPAKSFTKSPEHYLWEVIQTIEVLKVA